MGISVILLIPGSDSERIIGPLSQNKSCRLFEESEELEKTHPHLLPALLEGKVEVGITPVVVLTLSGFKSWKDSLAESLLQQEVPTIIVGDKSLLTIFMRMANSPVTVHADPFLAWAGRWRERTIRFLSWGAHPVEVDCLTKKAFHEEQKYLGLAEFSDLAKKSKPPSPILEEASLGKDLRAKTFLNEKDLEALIGEEPD